MTESAKFEMVITQKLFKLQPYGLTCVVMLTCGLTGKMLVELKHMSATRFSPLGSFEMESPQNINWYIHHMSSEGC